MTARYSRILAVAAALLVSVVFALGMATVLNYSKFATTLSGLLQNNVALATQPIEQSVRLSLALGLSISSMDATPALLERQVRLDSSIVAIYLSDPSGGVLYSSSPAPLATLPSAWLDAAKNAPVGKTWAVEGGAGIAGLGRVLRNSFDLPVAIVAVSYSTAGNDAVKRGLLPELISVALQVGGFTVLAGLLCLVAIGLRYRRGERLERRATWIIVLFTFAALLAVSIKSIEPFERMLLPKLEESAQQTGRMYGELILRAMSFGIRLNELVGVETVLHQELAQNPSLASISVVDPLGKSLYHVDKEGASGLGNSTLKIPLADFGAIEVEPDATFARKLVQELALDILIVLIVAFFFTLEILASIRVSASIAEGGVAACGDVRAPAFLFFLSEEISRPFLPNFVAGFAQDVTLMSKNALIGLPIMVFMLVVAVSQPWLGSISQHRGHKRLMMIGAVAAVTGYLMCALANSLYLFVFARIVCALGYSAIFVSVQGYILDRTDAGSRTAGFSLFVGAIMVATICGPSVGGILADAIGARATFCVAAGVALLALPMMIRLSGAAPLNTPIQNEKRAWSDFFRLLRNRRFMAICLCAAIPAKMLLTGCCFFLLPLYVMHIGGNQAMAGRLLMVYALLMVLITPVASRYSYDLNTRARFVLFGLLLSAGGGLLAIATQDVWPVFVLVITLGAGQAISITSQSALVADVCTREIDDFGTGYVYGIYRLVERIGNTIGPMLAGLLLTLFGFRSAIMAFGLLALCSALGFFLLLVRSGSPVSGKIRG